MSQTIIETEGLGKSYMIGHLSQGRQYIALRDVITNKAKEIWSRIRNPQYHTHQNVEEFWALKNISFSIKKGDRLGIIGRNGAGKTTLLKVLSRITEPTTGKAIIRGRVASLLEVGTGFHPELTGRENIFLNGAILGMSRQEIKNKFDEIVQFSEVEQFIDTPVKRFSSGMFVRLAFAVAAHLEPEILLIDEVLAVADYNFQQKCLGKMDEISSEGRTLIIISHNMASIKQLCDRCILLDKGSIIMDDVTEEVVNQYLGLHVDNKKAQYNQNEINDIKQEKLYEGIKYFEFHQVSISDNKGNLKLDYYSDEEIHVRIKFSCLKEVRRFRLGIYLDAKEGIHIMSSIFTDEENMLKHMNLQPGEYDWLCKIPPNLFGSNEFLFTIDMLVHTVHHLMLPNLFLVKTRFKGYNNVIKCVYGTSPFKPKLKWREV